MLGGCGNGRDRASQQLTVPAYGLHTQTTENVTRGSRAFCRADARAFAQAVRLFLGHYGASAAYPADLYYIDVRQVWTDFVAHECPATSLRPFLTQMLTPTQRRALLRHLPAEIAATIHAGLADR